MADQLWLRTRIREEEDLFGDDQEDVNVSDLQAWPPASLWAKKWDTLPFHFDPIFLFSLFLISLLPHCIAAPVSS